MMSSHIICSNGGCRLSGFIEFDGQLFFGAIGEQNNELYVADGESLETQLIININPDKNPF